MPFLLHSLEENHISDKGTAAMADGLTHNRTLTKLK
jgi:hypothetical protein